MDRKAELERKKAKLAAIREEKERRRREKEEKDKDDATNKLATGPEKDSHRLVWTESGMMVLISINNNYSSFLCKTIIEI